MDGTDNARADTEGLQQPGFQQDGPGLFDDGPALFDAPQTPAPQPVARPRTRSSRAKSKKKDAETSPEATVSALDEPFVQDGDPLIPLDDDIDPRATAGQPTEDEVLAPDEAELADPEVSSTPTLSAVEQDERSAEHTDEPAAEAQAPEVDAGDAAQVGSDDTDADDLKAELGIEAAPGVHVPAPHSPVLDEQELAELDRDDNGDSDTDEDADTELPAPDAASGALEVEASDAADPDADLPLDDGDEPDADDPAGEASDDFEVVVPEAFTTPVTEIAPPSVDLPEDAYGDEDDHAGIDDVGMDTAGVDDQVEEEPDDDFEPAPEDDGDIVIPASDPTDDQMDADADDDGTGETEVVEGSVLSGNLPRTPTPPHPPAPEAPLALYRRYRPETFAEVIGQEHVTEPLMRALENNRVNHAYLFSGPRGCGKTTSARILARALNCEQGPTPTPCGVCQSCRDLARGGGGSIDVIEIDAASHGGVDDARDLRERAFFAPVNSRYKIYIVDEAHMVTTAGFNAMLKLVEEPPPHVKFVFATTEPEKVIGTIRSRTHHYPFRLVPPKVLTGYLAELCEREGVAVEPSVLPLVVRAGAGSVRDSLSVLDQLLGGAGRDGVTYAQASALLGYTPESLLDDIMDAFAAGDAAGVFSTIDRVIEVGQDPRRFAEDLLRRLRDLVIVAAVPDAVSSGLIDVAPDQAERLQVQASGMGAGELTRAAEVIATGLTDMRGTTAPRLHLELMCSRVLLPGADVDERGIHARLDRLERRVAASGGALPAAPEPTPPARWDDVEAARPASPAPVAEQPAVAQREPQGGAQFTTQEPGPASREDAAVQPAGGHGAGGAQASGQRPANQAQVPQGQRPAAPAGQRPAGVPAGQRPAQGIPGGQRPAGGLSGQRPAPQDAAPPTTGAPQPSAAGATPNPRQGSVNLSATDLRREWPRVLDAVKSRRRFAWILLNQNAQVVDFADGVLTLGFVNQGARDSFVSGGSVDVLRDCLVQTLMLDARIDPIITAGSVSSSSGGGQGAPASHEAPPRQQVAEPEPPVPRSEWSQQARENIRPTTNRVEQVDDEPPPDYGAEGAFAASSDDIALDESAESATELIARQLGAEIIADEQL